MELMKLRRRHERSGRLATVATAAVLGVATWAPSAGVAAAAPASAGTARIETARGWAATQAPLPANAGNGFNVNLRSADCASVSSCATVGYYTDSANDGQGLLLTRSGTTWTPDQAPLPADAAADPGVNLTSVACPDTSTCVAAGYYTDSAGNQQGLLLTGSGTTWAPDEVQAPGAATDPSVNLTSVACPDTSTCVAAGYYTDSAGNQQGLLLTGLGTTWTATRTPLPANAATQPDVNVVSVTCPAASSCVAAGTYTDTKGASHPVLLTGLGATWQAVRAPLPGNKASFPILGLTAVTCATTSSCAAVGFYQISNGGVEGLLLTGSGSSWTAAMAPLPRGAFSQPNAYLDAVACPAASSCTVTGYYNIPSGKSRGVFITGWGRSWKATKAPLPSGVTGRPSTALTWVACPSVTACVATGVYNRSSGTQRGILLKGSGTSWKAAKPPLPANSSPSPFDHLFTVVCASTSSCLVTGSYADNSNNGQGLLLTGRS